MPIRSIILLLATVVIPGLALAAVGAVLVRQHGELGERRMEDQARLAAREAADSLQALLASRAHAVDPESSQRYPASNGVLNLGRIADGEYRLPFPPISSTFREQAFQRTLNRLREGGTAREYREASGRARHPDQKAFLEIGEAAERGEATEAALAQVSSGTRFVDEYGIPLSLWAMEATDRRDTTFSSEEWLTFSAIAYARDLGVDGFAAGEHELLAHVRNRFEGIEAWRLSPDSTWMIRRIDDAFVGIRIDSARAIASSIRGIDSVAITSGAQTYTLAPTFPYLHASIATDAAATSSLLWMIALGLVALVMAFGALNLFRDARRERRLAQLRAGFVSSVSHEVRTPLAGIRLLTDSMLAYGPGSDMEWRTDLETISYETDRLTRMLDNVLRASRIERGADRSWAST